MNRPFARLAFIIALLLAGAARAAAQPAQTFGRVTVGDGTTALPSITFSSDTGSGWYFGGDDGSGNGIIGATSHIVPKTTNIFDFGTSTLRWRNVFAQNNSYANKFHVGVSGTDTRNVMLRPEYNIDTPCASTCAGMIAITNGDESARGDLRVNRIAAGSGGGDPTFIENGAYSTWNFKETYALGDHYTEMLSVKTAFNPSANVTGFGSVGSYHEAFWLTGSTKTTTQLIGLYGAAYAEAASGTIPEMTGLFGEAASGGASTFTSISAVRAACCSYGTNGTITMSSMFHATQPYVGSTQSTTHAGLWIEDQTAGATFTPSSANYSIKADGAASNGAPFYVFATGRVQQADMKLSPGSISKPTCNSANRGTFWYTAGGAGVKDDVQVCAKDAGDVYAYRTIY
jgi:hypothetical protein